MEERNNGRPRMHCFGNFTLGDKKCELCPDQAACHDDQAGWGINQATSDAERTVMIEAQMRGVPDWVFVWDELSEEELEKLRVEEPERSKIFDLFNSGIQD